MATLLDNEKWQSFHNIHKYIQHQNLDSLCYISLKMDGSNCAIRCKKIESNWIIEKIIGRTTILWTMENTKLLNTLNYGKVGKLDELPYAMFEFTKNIVKHLSKQLEFNDIIIYGEVFRINKQRFPSWHPFAYKLLEHNIITMLNNDTYQLFNSNGLVFENSIFKHFNLNIEANIMETLENTNGYIICPPPMLFNGKLIDGINQLYPLMTNPTKDPNFEGVFIVLNDNAYKWKTGLHEEQKRIPKLTEFTNPSESLIQIYLKLQEVYFQSRKTNITFNSSSNESHTHIEQAKIIDELKSELKISLDKVLSKKESFELLVQSERKIMIPTIVAEVINELLSHYDEEIVCPWTIAKIKEHANKLIKPLMIN